MQCTTSLYGDVVGFSVLEVYLDRVCAATGWVFGSTGSCNLCSTGGTTLGGGTCTLGDGGSSLGDGCHTLGDGLNVAVK